MPGLCEVLEDQARMEGILQAEAGDIKWSAVRPGTLRNWSQMSISLLRVKQSIYIKLYSVGE